MLRRPEDMKEWKKETEETEKVAEKTVIVEETKAPAEADVEVSEVNSEAKAEEKPKAVKKAPAKRRTKKLE